MSSHDRGSSRRGKFWLDATLRLDHQTPPVPSLPSIIIMADAASYISRLPRELVREVTQHLAASPLDLLSISLVTQILRDDAQRILFRHPSQTLLKCSTPNVPLFIDAILLSPERLGPLVRTYTHQQHYMGPGYSYYVEYSEKVNNALRSMTNLKRLAVSDTEMLPTTVLHGCNFQLEAFSWGHKASAMEILRDFLPIQVSLKHLTFRCYHDFYTEETATLAAAVCPELQSLKGPRHRFVPLRQKGGLPRMVHRCLPFTDNFVSGGSPETLVP